MLLKPLLGWGFNSQKCSGTFVNWYYSYSHMYQGNPKPK